MIKKFKIPIIIGFVFIGLAIWIPDTARRSSLVTMDYLKEMILIMPPVFILMGLMEAWIPKDKIKKWLGGGSGIKGAALSFALGTLPTGPLYVAFPMGRYLAKKRRTYQQYGYFPRVMGGFENSTANGGD